MVRRVQGLMRVASEVHQVFQGEDALIGRGGRIGQLAGEGVQPVDHAGLGRPLARRDRRLGLAKAGQGGQGAGGHGATHGAGL